MSQHSEFPRTGRVRLSAILAPNGPAGTPGRQSVKQRFNQVTFLSPSPPFDRLRMSGARGGGGGSTPAGRGGDKRTSPEAGASPGSAPAPAQLITIGVLPQPVVALPTAAMPLADFSLLRPEPLTAEPGAYVSVDIAAAVSLPLRETTPPAAIMAQLLRPASLTAAPPAFNPLALAPLEIAGGELLPATALQPVPTAPGLPFAPPAIAAAMPRAVEQPREQAEPRDLEPSLAAATGSPTADTAPAPLPPAAANPLALQPLANPAAPPASQTPAAAQPRDFAALIDRLVEARDMAQASAAPGTVHAAVTHAEFGTVSLQFQHDAAGLTVALASADPEFARAVQAAAPAPGASDQHTQARQEAPGQQSSSSAQTPSNPQQRGQSAPRDAQDPRHSAGPGQRQRASDEPPTRGGIFA